MTTAVYAMRSRSIGSVYGVTIYSSRTIVTGPSFTSSTCMRAPKTPVSTATPSARSAAQKRS